MYIDINVLREQLPEYECKVYLHDYSLCLDLIERLNGALPPYFQHTLYLAESPAQLKKLTPIEYMNILVMNPKGQDLSSFQFFGETPVNLLDVHASSDQLPEIFHKLRAFFDIQLSKGLAGESLLEILFMERGLQSMIDEISPAFNNPVYLFDSGFNLIACNYEVAEKTSSGKKIIDAMGFTDDEYKVINAHGHIHERLKKTDQPIKVFHEETGFEQLLCAIDTRKDMGHLVIDGINRPISDTDQRLLYMLKMAIYQQMQKNEFIRDNSGYPYEYFLRDLLNEKIVPSSKNSERLNYLNNEFAPNKYCMVIEAARSNDALNTYALRSKFESLFAGTKTLVFNGQIIVIFSFAENKYMEKKEYDMVNALCTRENLFAGLSNIFTNILMV